MAILLSTTMPRIGFKTVTYVMASIVLFSTIGWHQACNAQSASLQSESSPSDDRQNTEAIQRSLTGVPSALPSVQAGGETVPPPIGTASRPLSSANATQKKSGEEVSAASATSTDESSNKPAEKRLSATSSDPTSRQLQNIVIQAIDSLEAAKIPNLDNAKQRLSAEVIRLENYLNPASANGQAWSKFLQLEKLKEELKSERPNVATMVGLETNMKQNYPGLEFSQFTGVRQGIGEVVRALRYGYAPEKAIEQLEFKLKQLVSTLDEPAIGAGTDRSFAVGLMANYLHEMNQAPAALAQLRQLFAVPNVQVHVREALINRLVARPVAEPNAVNECLLGTHVVGRAFLTGNVNADLLPMVGGVSLRLNMNANVTTSSNGYNRGVVFGTTAFSPVYASKTIFVTPGGISSTSASVATNLQTSINTIDHRFRIVRRIAKRKAAEQKPLADSIAQGRLQNRISGQYEQQVEQQLANARVQFAKLQSQTPPELTRLGVPLPTYGFHSDDSAVHGQVRQAAPFQLAAFRSSTISTPKNCDIVVEAHQSAVVNALDLMLGDRTIRSADLDDYARQATGTVSEEIQQEADGEAWSITLATYRPVEIDLDDSQVTIKLRVTQMTRGEQTLDDGSFVTAVYAPSYSNGVLKLTRQGEVDVAFARATRGLRVVTLRSFLKGKFDKFFKEQIVTQRLDMADRFPNLPKLKLAVMKIDKGWLQLGWQ